MKIKMMKGKKLRIAVMMILIVSAAALIWHRVSPILNVYGKEFYIHTVRTNVCADPRIEDSSLGEEYMGMCFRASDRVRGRDGQMWVGGIMERIYDDQTGEERSSGKLGYIRQSDLTLLEADSMTGEEVHLAGSVYTDSADHRWMRDPKITEDRKARIVCEDQGNLFLIDEEGDFLWADSKDAYTCEPLDGTWRVHSVRADILNTLSTEEPTVYTGYFGTAVDHAVRWNNLADPDRIYLRGEIDRAYGEDGSEDVFRMSGCIAMKDVTKQIDPEEGEAYRLIGSRYASAQDICCFGDEKAGYASGQDVKLLLTCEDMALVMTNYHQVVWTYTSDLYTNMASRRKITDEKEKTRRICVNSTDLYVDISLEQKADGGYFGTEIIGDEIWTDNEGREYLVGMVKNQRAVTSFADTAVAKIPSEKDYTCWLWGNYAEDEIEAQNLPDLKKKTDGCTVAVILDSEDRVLVHRKEDGACLWAEPSDVYEKEVRYTARFLTNLTGKPEYDAKTVKSLDYMTEIQELTPIHGDEIRKEKETEYFFRTIRWNGKYYYQLRYASGSKADTEYYSSEKKSVWNADSYGSLNAVQKDILRLGFYIMSLEGKNGKGIRYGHGVTESPFEPETTEAEEGMGSTQPEETKPETLADQNLNSTGVMDQKGGYWFDCSGFAAFVERSVFSRKLVGSLNDPELECTGALKKFSFRRGYNTSKKGASMSGILVTMYKEVPTKINVGDDILAHLDRLKPGDLLFFYGASSSTVTQNGKYDHVAIYLGVNKKSGVPEILHCTNRKDAAGRKIDGIVVSPLTGSMAAKVGSRNALGKKNTTGFVAAGRYVSTSGLLR